MTFAALRATIDQAMVFSTDFLGESVTFTPRGGTSRVIVACVEAYVPKTGGFRDTHNPGANKRSDGQEYIRVHVSRDESSASGGIAQEPSTGATIARSASVDDDTRPYVYCGLELVKEAKHAVYVFARDTRPWDTRRTAQT